MELGKAKKGSKKKGKKGAKKAAPTVDPEVERRNKQEALRLKLKDRLSALEKASRINKLKVEEGWKELMRVRKAESLRTELEQLASLHELRVDSKDALISSLDRELDVAEEMYSDAHRSHLRNIDLLLELQRDSVQRLENTFNSDIGGLKERYNEERKEILANHEALKQSILESMETMEAEFKEYETQSRQHFEEVFQAEKDKHTEEFNVQKITLEAALDDLKTSATEAYTQYRSATDQTQSQYQKLLERDKMNQKRLVLQGQHMKKLTDQISSWKAKISTSKADYTRKFEELATEKAQIQKHFRRLRNRIQNFRSSEKERLSSLSQSARNCIDLLSTYVELGESTVKIAQICHKLETQNEQHSPFYANLDEYEDVEIGQTLDIVPEMDRFYQRHNKVLVETVALRKEEERLLEENSKLKSILEQYLSAISVNDDVLANDNPLLTVNSLKGV
ncbi:hypothetical protein P9112_006668 [Eukaryota sp. TZLM1-RC]